MAEMIKHWERAVCLVLGMSCGIVCNQIRVAIELDRQIKEQIQEERPPIVYEPGSLS